MTIYAENAEDSAGNSRFRSVGRYPMLFDTQFRAITTFSEFTLCFR